MCTNAGPEVSRLYEKESIGRSRHHSGQPKVMFHSKECDDRNE